MIPKYTFSKCLHISAKAFLSLGIAFTVVAHFNVAIGQDRTTTLAETSPISQAYQTDAHSDLLTLLDANSLTSTALPEKKYKASFGLIGKTWLSRYNPLSLALSTTMFAYQRVLSPQIVADCPYQVSCSNFSKQSLARFGLVKGLALSADRLTRCNRLASADVPSIVLDPISQKIADSPAFYSSRNISNLDHEHHDHTSK
jgi:putative component of membrane protein insertase Oxa1/YidC/SpoIIIJ protein YidD